MSSSFWRFGNDYEKVTPINTLLKKSFIHKVKSASAEEQKSENVDQDSSEKENQRRDSSSSSDSDSASGDFDFKFAHDDDEAGISGNDNYVPNLAILSELLDEENLMDEVVGSNTKLIEYLKHREVLEILVNLILAQEDELPTPNDNPSEREHHMHSDTESEKETTEETQARRAQVAAEILSVDAWSLTDSFMDNSDLLGRLWGIMDKEPPLSMILSTYFMKINEHLLDLKIDEMLDFLLRQQNLVDRFLKHIDNPPLMDFLLKVISTDRADNPTGIIYLLKDQDLIPKLIKFLDPKVNSSIQSAAGDFMKAFIAISANPNTENSTIGPNELTREFVSEPIMEYLSDLMLNGGTSLANGVGIIIEVIRKNNSDYDFVSLIETTLESHPPTSRDPIYLGYLIKTFQKKIPQFTKLLKNSKTPDLETPFGKIEPLGFERFKICELVAELLHCSNMGLLNHEETEEIVFERDMERNRVIALEKQQQEDFQDDMDLSNEASKVIDRLSINSKENGEKIDKDNENDDETETGKAAKSSTDNQGDLNISNIENPEPEHEKNSNKGIEEVQPTVGDSIAEEKETQQPILESEPDSDDVDATLEMMYDDQEREIRRDPVVGDQLKIALADNHVILIILQMFFKFPWNNFLHNVVFDIVQQTLNGSMVIGFNKYLAIDMFGRGAITELIIDGQQRCEDYESETGLRLGYMGHLTLIAEEVVKFTALYPPAIIHQAILDAISTQEWTSYVTETLVETREKYNALLGGVPQEDTTQDKEDTETGGKLALDPNVDHDIIGSVAEIQHKDDDDNSNDKFSRFMSQELTNDLPDRFGSGDEDEDDDVLVGWENRDYSNLPAEQDGEDDYVDPNDDGQSYTKKNHPLYNDLLSPDQERSDYLYGSADDSSSSSSSDEEDRSFEDDDKEYTLTRTKSKELTWRDEN